MKLIFQQRNYLKSWLWGNKSRSRSKITALINKEYKEDLIDGYDIMKTRIGHNNSFETKITNLNTLPAPLKANGNREIKLDLYLDEFSLKNIKAQRVKSGKSNSSRNYSTRGELFGSTYDHKSMMLINQKEELMPHNPNMGNIKILANENSQENSQNFRMSQPKYFKNINMPASIPSHQNSIQPW